MFYFDTSAIVKLMFQEEHSDALRKWLNDHTSETMISNDLARTELLRTVRKTSARHTSTAHQILENFVLLQITTETYTSAGLLEPDSLRSLDALHLASMLELGEELTGLLCYDQRLIESAQLHNIPTVIP